MRIAFVNTDMNVGGIPKASIPLLCELVKRHEVTLILTNGGGDVLSEVPDGVEIKMLPCPNFKTQLIEALRHGRILATVKSLISYTRANNWIDSLYARICLKKRLSASFDLAIAYFGMNAKCVITTLECIQASKRVAFMHGEHPFKKDELNVIEKYYMRFDRLFSVSNAFRLYYINDFPACEHIFDVFYNIMDVKSIKEKAEKPLLDNSFSDKSKRHMVTVGRISPEKGQIMIPEVADKLLSVNNDFVWHIIGDGADFEKLKGLINDKGLQNNVILHGNAINPYPYIKAADIYVQPSYTEGYCLTIREAAILGRPIIATKVGGAWELFKDGHDIILCSPSIESIFEKISMLIADKKLCDSIGYQASTHDWSNLSEIHKLENL